MKKPGTYTAALVGLGRIAWRFDAHRRDVALTHFGAYRGDERVRLLCGFSPVEQERLDFSLATGASACSSLVQILDHAPDIVSICSPSEHHFEQTRTCLDAGVPMVWLEKPPTGTVAEIETLISHAACREGRSRVLVNYMRRYSGRYERLREIFSKQVLGRPLAVQVLYSQGLERNGSHLLDFVFSVAGEIPPREIVAATSERQRESPSFMLRFDPDLTVMFCGHDAPYHLNDLVLTCEQGRVSLLSGGLDDRTELQTENEFHSGFYRLRERHPGFFSDCRPDSAFSAALADLIDSHESGRQPRSNLRTAQLTQTVVETVRRGCGA